MTNMEIKLINQRIAWIDNIKLFAILCVILYHSSSFVTHEIYSAGWILETFNMALFFFISGLTSYYSIGKIMCLKDLISYVYKKFIRMLLPCIFVSLLVFQKPCAFWFLLTLFYYLISFATFHLICNSIKLNNYSFLLFLLLLFINIPKVGNDQEFIISFAIGLLFAKKYKVINKFMVFSKNTIICIIFIGFIIWLSLLPFYKSFYLNQFNSLLLNNTLYIFVIRQIMKISFAISCCLLFMKYFNKITKFSKWGGNLRNVYHSCYNISFF